MSQKDNQNLDHLLLNYFGTMIKTMKPNNDNTLKNLVIFLLRIVHIIGIFFLIFGCLFPEKLRDYHIIWCLKTLFLWYIFNGKCYLSMFITEFNDGVSYNEFLPTSQFASQIVVFISLIISISGMLFPEYSAFNIIKIIIAYLNKFN